MSSSQVYTDALRRALGGDRVALRRLVDALTPVIQARVARSLLRAGAADRRGLVRSEVEDMTQEIFCRLFANNGHVLHAWDEQKGLSLVNYVGLIAERECISILRSRRRNPYTERPTEQQDLESAGPERGAADSDVLTRQMARTVYDRLHNTLSPLGFKVFELLFCEEQSPESVCEELNMTADAVYAWRSRIRKQARALAEELSQERVAS